MKPLSTLGVTLGALAVLASAAQAGQPSAQIAAAKKAAAEAELQLQKAQATYKAKGLGGHDTKALEFLKQAKRELDEAERFVNPPKVYAPSPHSDGK